MEFLTAGVGACGACLVSNPLEVIKTRMQLQGELQAQGLYKVHYRNVFHATYTVVCADGVLALQKGLVPALWFQLCVNSIRLGMYQYFINLGWTKNAKGETSMLRCSVAAATSGCLGGFLGSPWSLVKTHLQAQSSQSVAVGHQHHHTGTLNALVTIIRQQGIPGLWRGVTGSIPRSIFGSATQLSTFTMSLEFINNLHWRHLAPGSAASLLLASCVSGVVIVCSVTPFDVISTRLYNQGVDDKGKGLLYKGFFDCALKMFRTEGILGFYKGIGPMFFRLGPHTVLSLVFWSKLRIYGGLDRKNAM